MRQLNKEGSFSVSWGSENPEPIQLKFGVLDD